MLGVAFAAASLVSLGSALHLDWGAHAKSACQAISQPPLATDPYELIALGSATRRWVASSPRNSHAQLARGVLLECVAARGTASLVNLLSKEDSEVCGFNGALRSEELRPGQSRTLYLTPIATLGCEKAARQAYERALSRDPSLAEARLRLAHLVIRQPRLIPLKNDDPKLIELSSAAPDVRIGFLASMFLGLAAEKRNDLAAAAIRYERARVVGPEWASARYALGSVLLQQGRAEPARDLLRGAAEPHPSDPWYGYACRIMTSEVLSELREWRARVDR
jgi:tetratricopeptide (TPR) repeat protein